MAPRAAIKCLFLVRVIACPEAESSSLSPRALLVLLPLCASDKLQITCYDFFVEAS